MKCPYCQATITARDRKCPICASPISKPARAKRAPAMALANGAMWTFFGLITVIILCLLTYRVYFWVYAWRLNNYYNAPNRLAPVVDVVDMDNGLTGHSITFFGKDGDAIFIKELRKSYVISGNSTRIEIPDSDWFGSDIETTESALVTLTPILNTESGDMRELPPLKLDITPPESPLTLVNPPTDFHQVNTSIYPLEIHVAPKSNVLINGYDVTDMVDYSGLLLSNVNVYAQGDNYISILVSTPNHKETRRDINLYRPYQEIALEPSLTQEKRSNLPKITVSGTVDPAATLSVDTPFVEDSIKVDEKGNFNFQAKLTVIGDNKITFRASMPGKQDSVESVTVYYVPTLNAYSRSAWAMDYENLSKIYDVWEGRIFQCKGTVIEVTVEGDEQTVILDVGPKGTPQYVVLTNYSSIGTPLVGHYYDTYADVTGSQFYGDKRCPKLACRYMIEKEPPA